MGLTTQRGVYNFDLPPTLSLRPKEPEPMEPKAIELKPMRL